MRLPQPRVLPFAIAFTLAGIGIRTVDVVSLAVSGAAFSTVTEAIAEPAGDKPAAADAKLQPAPDAGVKVASAEAPASTLTASHAPVSDAGDAKSETDLLSQLTEKRQALDARGADLDQREALLKAAEDRINTKVDQLSTMRSDLEKLLDLQKTKNDAQLASLVKIYEDMKPKDAAAIFNSLDTAVLIEVTGRMKEAKMAPILAAMDPGRARMLTVKLSERRRSMDNAVADAKSALGDGTATGAAGGDAAAAPAAAPAPTPAAAAPAAADKK